MDSRDLRFAALDGTAAASKSLWTLKVGAIALSCVTAIALLHPHPLVLPFLSAILTSAALIIAAAIAWRHRRHVESWPDRMGLAGLLMFFGLAASILCDPDLAVRSLGFGNR